MHNLYLIQSLIAQSFLDQLYNWLLQVSSYILGVIDTYGYAGIFIGMVIESIGIPLPSEIILPYAGYLAYLGRFSFWIVVIVGTFACLVGSLITYFIAFFGGNYLFERYGKYVGITERELHLANEWFEKYGEIFVFFSRMIPGVRAYSSIPAGICRMDLKKFSTYSFLGSLPWNTALAFIGFYLGANWHNITTSYYNIVVAVFLVLAVVILVNVLRSRRAKRPAPVNEGNR
jgi:membrane protein DedA with SNARE-associated domain